MSVIQVGGAGKMYRMYDQPQDRLKQMLFARFGRRYGHEFWALRGVSLEVAPGERVGIIGRNGSGKSTLLQMIAGTLSPTEGEVAVTGRVAALLELGSGFNPEFTGRENVFLNGAILGLTAGEMEARMAEIVAFADIGEFLDQPVKVYSSGMFVRLAFAVATTVDADVLLIDEALAVGDVFFQQKCYRRLESLRARGVAIVLVSHSMADIEQFCDRAMLLDHGQVSFVGPAAEAVRRYYLLEQQDRAVRPAALAAASPAAASASGDEEPSALGWPASSALLDISGVPQVSDGGARCTAVAICGEDGEARHVFEQGATATFFYEFELRRDIEVPMGGVVIQNAKAVLVHGKDTMQHDAAVPLAVPAGSRLRFRQEVTLDLNVDEYTFEVGLATLARRDYDRRAFYSHADLSGSTAALCHVPGAGRFAVVLRRARRPIQLVHHGVANLPGRCVVSLELPATSTTIERDGARPCT